ncbi:MAG: hypothetical protein RPR97_15515 [Colwellia sp.]|jgi:hypothetical protein
MGSGRRKLMKLFRDPRMFFYDSKIFNHNNIALEKVVSLPILTDSEKVVESNIVSFPKKIETASTNILVKEKKVGLPWVVGVVEDEIKFKTIKPAKLGLCTLISFSDSKLYKDLESIFSKGSFKGSMFSVEGDILDQTIQSMISRYKPFSSDWFDSVKCIVSVNGNSSAADVVSTTKFSVFRVNIIDDKTCVNNNSGDYDMVISFVEVSNIQGISRIEYVKSISEVESVLLDALLSIEYKMNKCKTLYSLMDSSEVRDMDTADFAIDICGESGVFNTFSEYLTSLSENDAIRSIYASEAMITKYSSMIMSDDLTGLLKKSLTDGARYEII